MGKTWVLRLIMLFQPEDSSSQDEALHLHGPVTGFAGQAHASPIKALVWTAIAIVAGLAIGHLTG